jgi:hypothetical protein
MRRTIFLLHCGKSPIIGSMNENENDNNAKGAAMSDVWDTKDGRRRVRRDLPTVEEAVLAAQGLTEEIAEQVEIVASLMEVPAEEAKGAVLRFAQRKDVNRTTIISTAGTPRTVVVERRTIRRPLRRSAEN